jgi:glycosyltransferase involved in cell wall biosynthesis
VPAPDVTVLIPTYQRPASLRRALDGVAGQQFSGSWDVLVVDNDPTGGAAETVRARALPVPLRYVVEAEPGAACARNRGIAETVASVLVMLDDDVAPSSADWLSRLVAPVLDGRADVVGGGVLLDPEVDRPGWFDEAGLGGYLTAVDLGGRARAVEPDEVIVTANLAARTSLLRASGGFARHLGPRGRIPLVGDDVQIVRALRAVGARVWWQPDAAVVHELPPTRLTPRYLLRRAWAQGRTDWLLDREQLRTRRWRGARVPLGWLGDQLLHRAAEGPTRSAVAFHAACDVVRTAGTLFAAATDGASHRPHPLPSAPPDR